MNLSQINTKLTTATGSTTTDYGSTERLIDINAAALEIQSYILDAQDEADFDDVNYGDYPIFTVPFVANQRDYKIDQAEHIVSMKKVSFTYDGSTYYEAKPIDSGEDVDVIAAPAGSTMETTIDGRYSKTAPRYDWKYGSLFIYPRASAAEVTAGAGAVLEWSREVYPFTSSDLSTGTMVPTFDSTFHPLLYLIPAFNWCADKGKDGRLPAIKERKDRLIELLRRQYGKKQKDRRMALRALYKNYK